MANELSVGYDVLSRRAIVRYSGDTRLWPQVRRLFQDTTDQFEIDGEFGLTLPWWAYLTSRVGVESRAQRLGIVIAPDAEAETRLRRASAIHAGYQAAIAAVPLGKDAVRERLAALAFGRKPSDEQARNIGRLVEWESGATFSVPGAGKTTEALGIYALRRTAESRLLVVCPKNAFAAWEEQLGACLPQDTPFVRLRGGKASIAKLLASKPDKALITYQQLPNVLDQIASYVDHADSFLFLDESHKIKRGLTGVIGNSLLSTATLPRTKLVMSGTPMPNDIADLVPQFRFLYPEIAADETNVESYIRPVYVRTNKDELDLPPVKPILKTISLRPAQFELYELLRTEAARQLKKGLNANDRLRLRRAGQSALRMLQLVSNPGLLARIPFDHPGLLGDVLEEGDSPKLEYACYRARELAFEGKKSIIWSSFVNNVELVARRLIDLGAEYIHGGVDAGSEDEEGTREQKIKRFHEDDDCWVLVANPAACGEGISLHTVCHHAIYLDRNYNAGQFLQSQDRIHRLGLPKNQLTYVEILIAPGTVDESVERRLRAKIANMARVLNDSSLMVEPETIDLDAQGFTTADFQDFEGHLNAA